MRNSLLTLLYATLAAANLAVADICSTQKCPQGKQPTSICFSDAETYSNIMWKIATHTSCGYFTKVDMVETTAEISQKFDELIADCKTIKELRFVSHGSEGLQQAGYLDQETIQKLGKYSCAFDKNAEIKYDGCNVGKGCVGDMLLFQTAKNLLSINGGSVRAATTYTFTVPVILPHMSLNGKHRKINYNPTKTPSDSWTQTGLTTSEGGSINEVCSNEMDELIEEFKSAKGSAIEKGCNMSYGSINSDRLREYQKIQRRLSSQPPYLQSADSQAWHDLISALKLLKFNIRLFELCEAEVNLPSKSEKGGNFDGVK